jgi:hypothetical protein
VYTAKKVADVFDFGFARSKCSFFKACGLFSLSLASWSNSFASRTAYALRGASFRSKAFATLYPHHLGSDRSRFGEAYKVV